MRHKVKHRKFGRHCGHRKALLRNLAKSLIKHEQIESTVAKVKDLRPLIEKMVSRAAGASLHDRRVLISELGGDDSIVSKLFSISQRYQNRNGGYTRIVKTGYRLGDAAPMAIIQFVQNA